MCACCGGQASNVHHVIQKGSPHFGDDVPGNFLAICGSGTMGCHGAIHGSPYTDSRGRYWTTEDVAIRLGSAIAARTDIIEYVLDKLGEEAGFEFLLRTYHSRAA